MNSPHSFLLRVAIPCPLRSSFDYWAPVDATPESCQPGVRVRVPFGRREMIGICLELPKSSNYDATKIKAAIAVLDDQPVLSQTMLDLLIWTSQYYVHPIGETIAEAMPTLLRQGRDSDALVQTHIDITDAGKNALQSGAIKRAKRQEEALNWLVEQGGSSTPSSLAAAGISATVRHTLNDKQYVSTREEKTDAWTYTPSEPGHTLNDEQQHAVDSICKSSGFHTFLCAGITGSGKTEVYYQAMEPVLARGQSVLLLVPEIALTPQTLSRLEARFHVPVVATHSGLTTRDRYHAWLRSFHDQAAIVVGTRSAVFMPCPRLGLIVVDESHDNAFKQASSLRYHARDIAIKRAHGLKIPIVLGTATPSLESLYNVERGLYQLLTLSKRAGKAKPPAIRCIEQNKVGLNPDVIKAIEECLENKQQALLFLNRRGYAPLFLCHHCGSVCHCDRCDVAMTYHREKQRLVCHHCDRKQAPPKQCPECQQANHIPYGLGTEQLEETCRELFPSASLCRIDRDTTRNRDELKTQLERIHTQDANILIGTQMLAKGHHFPALSLVVIVNADQGFFCSDFRAIERTGQLIMQVSGRCGRDNLPGTVLIQTALPDFPPLQQLIQEGYLPFAKQLLKEREEAHLPPSYAFVLIGAQAKSAQEAERGLHQLRDALRQDKGLSLSALGPMPAAHQKINDVHRFQLGLLTQSKSMRAHVLNRVCHLISQQNNQRVRYFLDVDAQALL